MKVALSKDAQKQYRRLPIREQNKITKKLADLEQNPLAGKKLGGEMARIYSLKA